ncbi:MAG: hypothetical protein EXS35_01075 [Pedosphaera sp.]|nr:hypothetical protein [Pedosphaera sp.]
MIRRLAELPGLVFAVVFAWKVALFGLTLQPVPANDSYFYDGAVVNALNGGAYCNPSLALALKISGKEVFSAYPPLYQGVLWCWMRVLGTSEVAAMALHIVLFGFYLLVLHGIFRRLKTPAIWGNLAGLFLFVITFQDRPDSLAQLLGVAAIYCWVRAYQKPGLLWAWLTTACVTLALSTSLQLGGVYFCLVWLMTVGAFTLRKDKFPVQPLVGTILIPLGLVALVKFGFPRLWEGFQEHAAQTPAVAGLRVPGVDDWLKVSRTVPGVFAAALLALALWLKNRGAAVEKFSSRPSLVALGCLAAVLGISFVALTYLSTNFALPAAYLQPLVVGGLLTACGEESFFRLRKTFWVATFLALAALGAVRAVGMSTWGVACAADVGHTEAIRMVQDSLNHTPSGSAVAVSAGYLYEAARHKNLRAIHSDWLAPGRHSEHLVELVVREKPVKLILTQFDYYRHFVGPVKQMRDWPHVVTVKVTDAAHTPVPDASRRWQKVVQHISWAPVIVELDWR